MSRHPREMPPVPEATMRLAHAAFPRGNTDMRIRDELGAIDDDQRFAALVPPRGAEMAGSRCHHNWRP